MLNKGLVRT